MNKLRAIMLWELLLAAVVLIGCDPPATPASKPSETKYDQRYTEALAVADAFCDAWREGDEGAGRMHLSRRILRKYPDSQIRDAIVGLANPRHAAYEILGGKQLAKGRYSFRLRLFFGYTGGHADRLEADEEHMVVELSEAGKWVVDEFPIPQTQSQLRTGPIIPPVK